MPRVCTICGHPKRSEIDEALLRSDSLRNIAERYGTSATALHRHKAEHLPAHLVKAKEVAEILDADNLIDHLQRLRMETLDILAGAKRSGDSRTMLLAIQRAEAQLRLAGELVGQLGQLRAKVDVNVRVIRSLADLRNDELDAILRETEALLPPEEQVKLLAPPLESQ
jgi:hypothetical protein